MKKNLCDFRIKSRTPLSKTIQCLAIGIAQAFSPVFATDLSTNTQGNEGDLNSMEVMKKQKPVVDAAGNPAYIIMLNESYVRDIDAKDEAPPKDTMSADNGKDVKGWHLPKARKVVKLLEKNYGFEATRMTSYIFSSVTAYLPQTVLNQIKRDPVVDQVIPVYEGIDFAAPPPWADSISGGETISWGKTALETNDLNTSSTTMYVIDGGVLTHPDLNITVAPVNTYIPSTGQYAANWRHATHVAGIIGAKSNNAHTRGINPNQPIISVHSGIDPSAMYNAIDWVTAHAEQYNVYGVANMSISHNGTDKIWAHDAVGGRAIRGASNRVLFVQAAGNLNIDACNQSFATTYNNSLTLTSNPVDGIVVVGGLNANGAQQFPFDQPDALPNYTGSSEQGSNYGTCVEMWAPSKSIKSSWPDTYVTPVAWTAGFLSGTSMAAPHIAALAARFGATNATPVQREYHLRSRLSGYPDAGWYFADISGIPIKMPQFNKTPAYTAPNRLNPVGITTSATLAGTTPSATQDGKYFTTTSWNAGSPIGWIEFDLGTVKTIRAIRMTPEQDKETGPRLTTHNVFIGNTPAPTSLQVTINEVTSDRSPIARKFSDAGTVQGRYVRIASNTTGISWLAWREIEIYGN